MNKKGFTLIELLAVILILGVIALIAIPIVNNVITESRIASTRVSLFQIIKDARTYQILNSSELFKDAEHDYVIVDDLNSIDSKEKIGDNFHLVIYKNGNVSLSYLYNEKNCLYFDEEKDDIITTSDVSMCGLPVPVYQNKNLVLTGSNYFDTGIKLYDTDKDFTLIIAFTSQSEPLASAPPTLIHSMFEGTIDGVKYPGFTIDIATARMRTALAGFSNAIYSGDVTGKKLVYSLRKKGNEYTGFVYDIDNQIRSKGGEYDVPAHFNQNVILGAYTKNGSFGRYFTGTIHSVEIYLTPLTDEDITNKITNLMK